MPAERSIRIVSTLSRPGQEEWPSELRGHLDHWVETGIVTPDQARAIADYEGIAPAAGVPEGGPQAARLGLVAEAVSYLGIALMTASGALVVARFWKDLHIGGRLALGVAMTVAGLAAAAVVGRIGDPGSHRLSSFLQLFATGGVALTAGVSAVALGSHTAGVTAVAVGPAVLCVSAALWRNRERVLPFLSSVAGGVVGVVGLYTVADWSLTTTEKAFAVWAAAVALGVLAASTRLRPTLAGLLVAEVGALVAALFVVNPHHALGLTTGLVTALAALFVGMGFRHNSVEAVAVIGSLVFLGYTLALYVKGPAGAVAILVLGAVLVALAIRAGLHHKALPSHPNGHTRRPRFP